MSSSSKVGGKVLDLRRYFQSASSGGGGGSGGGALLHVTDRPTRNGVSATAPVIESRDALSAQLRVCVCVCV